MTEILTWKTHQPAECPKCKHRESYTFYLNAETLNCNDCGYDFPIEIHVTNLKVISK